MNLLALRFSCLSSCSYIKPQPVCYLLGGLRVVYHLVPTSNHNSVSLISLFFLLFIILFLHQTTTQGGFIKEIAVLFIILFLHQTTTIVAGRYIKTCCLSSCSYIKPQPVSYAILIEVSCLSSCSYIKPQRLQALEKTIDGCLSSCSYIKPQPSSPPRKLVNVVYHLVPTSNHNSDYWLNNMQKVVYHLVPTSNHN